MSGAGDLPAVLLEEDPVGVEQAVQETTDSGEEVSEPVAEEPVSTSASPPQEPEQPPTAPPTEPEGPPPPALPFGAHHGPRIDNYDTVLREVDDMLTGRPPAIEYLFVCPFRDKGEGPRGRGFVRI